jgi:hypothetical protein
MPNRAKPPNPFQPAPGADPPLLVGRSSEEASIQDACARVARGSAPTPLAFLGLRGLGKTVLLNEIRARTGDGVHLQVEVETGVSLAVSMRQAVTSLQGAVDPLPKRLGKALLETLRSIPMPSFELPHDLGAVTLEAPPMPESAGDLPLGQALQILNDAVFAANTYLVVTVDEVHDADVAGLRSLVARVHQSAGSRAPILFACAGLPETANTLRELRTYVKRWDRFELDFLTRAETAAAIRIPIERAGRSIADAALEAVVVEAAGYPAFIQRYASAVWNEHEGESITVEDVSRTIPAVRSTLEKLFYQEDFAGLSARERLFCKVLADLGPGGHNLRAVSGALGVASAAISSIRTNLIRKGVVFSPSSGTVAFRLPLADRYVRKNEAFFFDAGVQQYMRDLAARSRDA